MNNLLLVDDENNLLKSLHRILRNQPFHCFTASSADEALEIIEKHPIDVIVSDYNMPHMNGIELLKIVKQQHPDIVRLMLTGQNDAQLSSDAINEGIIYKFLLKPCSVQYFIKQIKEAFSYHRQLRQQFREKAILATVFDAVVITDDNGNIVEHNMAYDLLMGESDKTPEKSNFIALLEAANEEESIITIKNALTHQGFWVGQASIIDNLKQKKTVWLSSTIIKKSNGEIINYVYSLIDK